jgi:hypothetical protein
MDGLRKLRYSNAASALGHTVSFGDPNGREDARRWDWELPGPGAQARGAHLGACCHLVASGAGPRVFRCAGAPTPPALGEAGWGKPRGLGTPGKGDTELTSPNWGAHRL